MDNKGFCWGDNEYGQIDIPGGNGGPYRWISIKTSFEHTCGILVNQSARCWGRDKYINPINNEGQDKWLACDKDSGYDVRSYSVPLSGPYVDPDNLFSGGVRLSWPASNLWKFDPSLNDIVRSNVYRYQVQTKLPEDTTWSNHTSYTNTLNVTSYPANTIFEARVRGEIGHGVWTNFTPMATVGVPPKLNPSLQVTATQRVINVTGFLASGHANITGFECQIMTQIGSTSYSVRDRFGLTSLSLTMIGGIIRRNAEYTLRCRAQNIASDLYYESYVHMHKTFSYHELWGAPVVADVRTLPDMPSIWPSNCKKPSIEDVKPNGFAVLWYCYSTDLCGGADPSSSDVTFTLIVTRSVDNMVVLNLTESGIQKKSVDILEDDTDYKVQVAATNVVGSGPFSDAVLVRTRPSSVKMSVAFRMRLDLPFTDWNAKKDSVIDGVAQWLSTNSRKVKVVSVEEGSTILALQVNVRDSTVVGARIAAATQGQMRIAGYNVTSVSSANELASNGASVTRLEPNMVPLSMTTVVTLQGSGFDSSSKCVLDGTRIETTTFISSTELECAVFLTQAHLAPLLSVTNGSSVQSLSFYDMNMMSLIDLAPSSGLVTGGTEILLHMNQELAKLLSDWRGPTKKFEVTSMQCRFTLRPDEKIKVPAQFLSGGTGRFADYRVFCKSPSSFFDNKGEGGVVHVELSLDSQHWLRTALNYTYHCPPTEYYVPRPRRGQCTLCPAGAICDGTDQVFPQDNWYALNSPTEFKLCLNPLACQNRNSSEACTKPYRGLLCSGCRKHYGINADFECIKCESKATQIATFVGVLVLALLVSGSLVAYTVRQAEKDDDDYKSGKNKPIFILQTAISMMTSLGFFKDFDYTWPEAVKGLLATSATASGGGLGLFNISCVMKGLFPGISQVYAEAILCISLPPFCLFVFVIVLITFRAMGSEANLSQRLIIATLYVVFLFQPLAIQGILKALTCHAVGTASYLFYDMDVKCWSGSYGYWFITLLLFFFFYAVFLPGLNLFALFKDAAGILAAKEEVLREWGFEISAYKKEYYYWNLVIMCRKVLLTAVITLSRPMGIVVQSQLAILIAVVALVVHVRCEPYHEAILNRMEGLAICTFCITAWLGILMSQEEVGSVTSQAASLCIVFINAAVFLYMGWHLLIESRKYVEKKLDERRRSMMETELSMEMELTDMTRNPIGPNSDAAPSREALKAPEHETSLPGTAANACASRKKEIADLLSHLKETEYELSDEEEEEGRAQSSLPTMGSHDNRTSSEENAISIQFDVYHNDLDDAIEKQDEGSAVVSV